MKKLFFAFILILLCLLPSAVFASEQFSYSFENPEDAALWYGGVFDDSNSFENGYSLFVNNPFGEVRNEHAVHVLDYAPTVSIEAGKVYTLSGYVFNPLSSYTPSIRSNITLGAGSNTIIASISGIGDEWSRFSTTFYTGESGSYNLSLHFADGYVDFGFFVDELRLEETQCTLSSLNLVGQTEILIPASGSIKSYYRPFILTSDNKTVDILSSSNTYFSVPDSPGISFNSQEFSLTVTSAALPDTTISIACTLRNYANLAPTFLSVTLTDNMIDDANFSGENPLWTSTSKITPIHDGENKYISIPTNDYGDFGYFAAIKYENSQVLLKDVLYVIRARIKSDNPKSFSAIYAKNSAEIKNNTLYFSIKDISGEEWIDVFAAFVPEESGIYDIALNLCSTYDCTIFIDDISLSCEVLKPEYITLHAPGNIALPNSSTSYPVSALMRDQLGNIIPCDDVSIELLGGDGSIGFDSNEKLITVNPDTPAGNYTLIATYLPDAAIRAELTFTVSSDYIGDGTFEKTVPNEWWMVSSPYECDFYIRHDGHSRRALINCKGNYFMLLNNSYVHLQKNKPYVFNSCFAVPTDCTATLFVEKLDNTMLPLAQFIIKAGSTMGEKMSPELFLAEEDAVGRLFLYIESNNGYPFSIYADNLSLKNASILAVAPRITGIPYVNGAVQAEFTLFNNIAENSDTSACIINWYISDLKNGIYKEVLSGRNIYFDTTFLNKYVYFEIIPICPVTGFSGTTVRSFPFMVTYDPSENISSLPMFTANLNWQKPHDTYFFDAQSHWAEEYINILFQSSVVSGKSKNLFKPEDHVTRAEFAKMLSIAFSINTPANIPSFEDVSSSDWYYSYVTSLYLSGITDGTSPTAFSPDKTLSREEAVVMMVRLYEKATGITATPTQNIFTDEKDISPWASDAAKKAAHLKIVQGYPGGYFAPQNALTRAQAAAMICNAAKILMKG